MAEKETEVTRGEIEGKKIYWKNRTTAKIERKNDG